MFVICIFLNKRVIGNLLSDCNPKYIGITIIEEIYINRSGLATWLSTAKVVYFQDEPTVRTIESSGVLIVLALPLAAYIEQSKGPWY